MGFKPLQQNRWLIVLGCVGVACLLIGTLWNGSGRGRPAAATVGNPSATDASVAGAGNSTGASSGGDGSVISYENFLDKQLTSMLKRMAGVRDVSVMVVLDSTEQLEVAMNQRITTQNQNGGQGNSTSQTTDKQVFTEHSADGAEVPFVVRRDTPTVRGVFVTVNADDFYVAKDEIIDAVSHVLDVPAYKISVAPQQANG